MPIKLKTSLAALLLVCALGVFIFSCFATASDAQGVFIFIFTIPALATILGLAFLFLNPPSNKIQRFLLLQVKYFSFFIILFFVTAFIPGLNKFPEAVIGGVSSAFEGVTGKSPYAWTHSQK